MSANLLYGFERFNLQSHSRNGGTIGRHIERNSGISDQPTKYVFAGEPLTPTNPLDLAHGGFVGDAAAQMAWDAA